MKLNAFIMYLYYLRKITPTLEVQFVKQLVPHFITE